MSKIQSSDTQFIRRKSYADYSTRKPTVKTALQNQFSAPSTHLRKEHIGKNTHAVDESLIARQKQRTIRPAQSKPPFSTNTRRMPTGAIIARWAGGGCRLFDLRKRSVFLRRGCSAFRFLSARVSLCKPSVKIKVSRPAKSQLLCLDRIRAEQKRTVRSGDSL